MNADNLNKWLTLVANVGVVIGLVRAQIHQARSDS